MNPACGTPINTTVWAYGTPTQAPVYPGRTFVAFQNRLGFSAYEVTYNNKLVDGAGRPLPSYLPVDNTLDWANPGAVGGLTPVPLVAHLHGGDTQYLSDGLPDAWARPMPTPTRPPTRGAQASSKAGCTASRIRMTTPRRPGISGTTTMPWA